jgi:hypothetical protein
MLCVRSRAPSRIMVDAAPTAEMGFGGWPIGDHRDGLDDIVFPAHPAKNPGHAGCRLELRGDYGAGDPVQSVVLGAVGIVDWRLDCRIARLQPPLVARIALT